MSYTINLSSRAEKVLKKWKKSKTSAFKKFKDILPELEQHPRTGSGHPEPLVGGSNITYSRRISKTDRMIYDIYDEFVNVLIIELEGHYNDK